MGNESPNSQVWAPSPTAADRLHAGAGPGGCLGRHAVHTSGDCRLRTAVGCEPAAAAPQRPAQRTPNTNTIVIHDGGIGRMIR
jgi:hypothetical protein